MMVNRPVFACGLVPMSVDWIPLLVEDSGDEADEAPPTRKLSPLTRIVRKNGDSISINQQLTEAEKMDRYQADRAAETLTERLADYEARGWLRRKEYLRYREILNRQANARPYVEQISNELDNIANRRRQSVSASVTSSQSGLTDTTSMSKPTSILQKPSRSSAPSKSKVRHVSWEDQSQDSNDEDDEDEEMEEDKENEAEQTERTSLILEPADLWTGHAPVTEQQLQELFVEMCFFARLGFVQPPCCLQCTYKETMDSNHASGNNNNNNNNQEGCPRWVVWRRNTDTPLHPNRLDGNVVIMRCHVARSLLQGQQVAGTRWDEKSKRLLSSGSSR